MGVFQNLSAWCIVNTNSFFGMDILRYDRLRIVKSTPALYAYYM